MIREVLYISYYDRKIAEQIFRRLEDRIHITWMGEDKVPDEEELIELIPGFTGVISSSEVYTERVYKTAKDLRFIFCDGTGYNNVNIDLATKYGILVGNAPVYSDAAADFGMALILELTRKIVNADSMTRQGKWNERNEFKGICLRGKVLGIIGFGRVGSALAIRAKAFGMKVVGYDIRTLSEQAKTLGVEILGLDELLSCTDIVSLCVPLTDKTRDLLNREHLGNMKQGSYLVNISRGNIVDEKEVYRMLKKGHLSGAAFDVYACEPIEINNPLLSLPNVIVTPHIAGDTFESQYSALECVAQNIQDYLEGKRPSTLLNPEAYYFRKIIDND